MSAYVSDTLRHSQVINIIDFEVWRGQSVRRTGVEVVEIFHYYQYDSVKFSIQRKSTVFKPYLSYSA